ncbi:sensor histidine kinase [Ideonella sp. BN130291]|uniref:sensor histidine kinase n=1 Tax=Ideonella sp. BN130291 TaxID=3112940 RepID=UPI002E276D20|nr:histidine kinase [Ideonella sp. BN130291]
MNPTRTPAAPPFRTDRTWQHTLRHGAQVMVFNTVLWILQMVSGNGGRWDITLVYNQAIGLSIWAIIDFGRRPLSRPTDKSPHWPSPGRAVGLIVGGILGGWVIGSVIGDWYCGCSAMGLFSHRPGKLLMTLLVTVTASTVATYYFYSHGRHAEQREKLAAAERDATLARLALLQSQLEPHMLFNTLANLRVLIGLDPVRAQAMLDRLIAFLRATLTASRTQAHSLASEFDRLDDYLQLMAVRMGPRLSARFDLPDELRQVQVPPLLLQPLVENCIHHALEPKVEGGRIEVSARRDGGQLVLSVRDTGVGLDGAPASNGTKFGLKQVQERLRTLYGDAAAFNLQPADDAEGGTLACIRLPAVPVPHSASTA